MDETDGNEDYDTIISADDGRAILGAQVETHHHIQSQAQRTARTIVAVVGIVATIVLTNPNVTILFFLHQELAELPKVRLSHTNCQFISCFLDTLCRFFSLYSQ